MLLVGSWLLARRVVAPLQVALALSFLAPAQAALTSSAGRHFEEGLAAYDRGAFEDAVGSWTEAARAYAQEENPTGQITALIHLSRAYSALGQPREAVNRLTTALELSERRGDAAHVATLLAELGSAHLASGSLEAAETSLSRGLDIATELGDEGLAAVVQNTLGNVLSTQGKYPDAILAYQKSVDLGKRAGLDSLTARALANQAVALRHTGQSQESIGLLDAAFDQLRRAPPSHDTAFALITIGLAYRELRPSLPHSADALLLSGAGALREAGTIAARIGDRRMTSYAWGHLGTLYEDEHRYPEALQLTRSAIFAAQQVHAPESLYRWEWQAGRLLVKLGVIDKAIESYRRAVATLQSIRPELGQAGARVSFRESIGPVYFELTDLLLRHAATLANQDKVGPYLIEARETVELFKAAELRDYFRDDCVDAFLSKVTTLESVARTAVVVYPIVLPDRLELLVSLPSGLRRVSVPVGAETLTREVRQFRRRLEKRTTREYLPHAQQLYRWLIAPLEPELTSLRVDTLIFVPDGPLRTIPMAALHDGKQFLVAKYALGITPGLNLTDPRPLRREQMKMLAVGVTEAVQGFPPLPNVANEIETLRAEFGSATLVDREFVVANLAEKLRGERFTVVHIASHAEFGGDVNATFLLTFDGRLSMDRLEQLVGVFKFREDPLELLTLSACDTAAGDDRAALGLAGVAIKAGARSALATLWQISDPASADLVADFYRGLKDPSLSRAAALQRAQLKMLADPRYEHPGFWSPFLLINNWL